MYKRQPLPRKMIKRLLRECKQILVLEEGYPVVEEMLKEMCIRDREQIDRQLANFEKGFDYVDLSEPATIGNGIIRIEAEDEERLNANFDKARQECELLKMVPASGSATRMFKDLFTFMDTYTDVYKRQNHTKISFFSDIFNDC